MKVKFYCPWWGSENLGWDEFLQKVKIAGYDGVELGVANDVSETELDEVWNKANKFELEIIPQHYQTYESDFSRHFDIYSSWFDKIEPYEVNKINSQTGKDFFTFDQNLTLIEVANQFSKATNTEIVHETHRNKFSFAAHVAAQYFKQIPQLKITFDVSHWICVAESYLGDQEDALILAAKRAEHIHARVGYPQGPQVSDPRLSEWKEALDFHLKWWDRIVERKRKNGDELLTITPEFGPYPYMVRLPFTKMPISGQWEINKYMMDMLKDRYSVL